MPKFINNGENRFNLYIFIATLNKLNNDIFSLQNRLLLPTESSNETTLPNNFFYLSHFRKNLSAINLFYFTVLIYFINYCKYPNCGISFCSPSNIRDDKIHEANNINA